jgi:DNA-binding PadR family transcriptional regulator
LFPALHRLEEKGWLTAQWGESENRRRAKYYTLTSAGRRQIHAELANWQRVSAAIAGDQGDLVRPDMPLLRNLAYTLLRHRHLEQDLDEEVRSHLELLVEQNMPRARPPSTESQFPARPATL